MSKETMFSDFNKNAGKETYVGEWLTITQERINQFAEITEERQWIHVDPERAKRESPFGDTVAHGYLVLSLLPRLMEGMAATLDADMKLVVNYGLNRVRFMSPVKVNSRIRVRNTLKEVQEIVGGLQIVNEETIDIEGQEKPACVAETLTRFYF
jgi:acyl dehydratase